MNQERMAKSVSLHCISNLVPRVFVPLDQRVGLRETSTVCQRHRFPAPLDKGNEGSWNEIVVLLERRFYRPSYFWIDLPAKPDHSS